MPIETAGGKRRKCWKLTVYPFPTMFSVLSRAILVHINLNPFPDDKNLTLSKLKLFEDDKINVA